MTTMKKVYIVRAQGLGWLIEHIYDSPPIEAALKEILATELVAHGVKNGEPRERWVRVVELDVKTGAKSSVGEVKGVISPEILAAVRERESTVIGAGDVGEISFSGRGTVTNPE